VSNSSKAVNSLETFLSKGLKLYIIAFLTFLSHHFDQDREGFVFQSKHGTHTNCIYDSGVYYLTIQLSIEENLQQLHRSLCGQLWLLLKCLTDQQLQQNHQHHFHRKNNKQADHTSRSHTSSK